MKNLFWALTGLFFGLWLTERRHTKKIEGLYERMLSGATPTQASAASNEPRKSRTIAEISPLLKEHKEQKRRLFMYGGRTFTPYVHKLTGDLIKPNMTELEAKLVHDEISWLMRDMMSYETDHQEYQHKQQDTWLDEEVESNE